MNADQLARIVIERIIKDWKTGASYVDESARRVHHAALRSALQNLYLETRPHDAEIARLFLDAAEALPAAG